MEPTDRHPDPMTGPDLTDPHGPGVLAQLRAEFPQFRISREIIPGHTRYVARRREPGTHPHTLVTPSIAELRTALQRPQP